MLPVPAQTDRIKYLTPEEAKQLENHLRERLISLMGEFHQSRRYKKGLLKDFRDYLLTLFLLETGARIDEALKTQRKHLKLYDARPHVELPTLKRRRTMTRRVPVFSDLLITALSNFILYREAVEGRKINATDPVFTMSKRQAERVIKKILLQVVDDKTKAHPHALRHTYGVLWTMRGLNPFILASWMGHATMNTTLIYTQIAIRDNYDYARELYQKSSI